MKVLYLTYDGLLDPLGQSQVLPYLYGLADALGVEFHIISFEKKERRQGEAALRGELIQRRMHWYPLSFTRKPPILAKAYDSWRFAYAARGIVRRQRPNLLHARSYVAGWVAHQLSRRYRIPWIFDMRGFWADERRETHAWREGHPFYDWLYATWKRRERLMLDSAAHVIVLTEAARTVLMEWGIAPEKITVIPCVADYEHFQPQPSMRTPYRTQLGIPESAFVLGYVGSIGPLYRLDEMLRFFQVLRRHLPESYMVFFTPASPEEVKKAAIAQGIPIERLRILFIPRKELPQWSSVIDASIIFCQPGFSRIGSSPTRIAELLAMNIPVIAQVDLGDNLRLSEAISGLYLCDIFSEESYEKVATQVLQDRTEDKWQAIRPNSESLLSMSVGHERYIQIYAALQRTKAT